MRNSREYVINASKINIESGSISLTLKLSMDRSFHDYHHLSRITHPDHCVIKRKIHQIAQSGRCVRFFKLNKFSSFEAVKLR